MNGYMRQEDPLDRLGYDDDPLAPASGCILGLFLGLLFWLGLAVAIVWWLR